MNGDTLLPKTSSGTEKERHSGEGERWQNFARRAQKNPHMKRECLKRQNGRCALCHREVSMDNCVLHHLDYDRVCVGGEDICIKALHPTEKRPNRTRTYPDCEHCHRETPSEFAECLSRLVMVHNGCHQRIHKSSNLTSKQSPSHDAGKEGEGAVSPDN